MADNLCLYLDNDGNYLNQFIKLPKKKTITIQWLMNKLNNDKVYKSFANKFQKLLKTKIKNSGYNVYATTYGIGVSNFLNFKKEKQHKEITKLLTELNIEYKTEYSDGGWVFRFKISKSERNIQKINEFINK